MYQRPLNDKTAVTYKGKWYTSGLIVILDYCSLHLPGGNCFQAEVNSDRTCFRGVRTAGYSPYAMYVAEK